MLTVIIITGNNDLKASIESILMNNYGVHAFIADSGKSALKIISNKTFDLVITDEMLSDMTGLQLVKELISISPMLNCAAISSLSSEDFHEAFEGLGILMQLPSVPGKDDIEKLLTHLNKIINPG